MALVESGLNSEYVSKIRPIYIEKCILKLKIVRAVLILSGHKYFDLQQMASYDNKKNYDNFCF